MTATVTMSEREWDNQLFNSKRGLAPMLGWTNSFHVLYSKGSAPGFPDRVLVRNRIIYAELKRDGGKPTDKQTEWLGRLVRAGGECYLWKPADLDEIARVLSGHWEYRQAPRYGITETGADATGLIMYYLATPGSGGTTFMPASMWTGSGRRDEQ